MPLIGEYAPSTSEWSRGQAELYEATNGEEGGDLRHRLVIVLTSVGAKTGKLRKTPLMRVDHEGVYAVVASLAAPPSIPSGITTPKTWVARAQSRTARKEVAFGPNRATPAGEWRVEGTAPRRAACPAFVL